MGGAAAFPATSLGHLSVPCQPAPEADLPRFKNTTAFQHPARRPQGTALILIPMNNLRPEIYSGRSGEGAQPGCILATPPACFGRLDSTGPGTRDVGGWSGCAACDGELGGECEPEQVGQGVRPRARAARARLGPRGIPGLSTIACASPCAG